MRGSDAVTGAMFSYVDLESRVRRDHPLRTIRTIVNEVLASMSGDFEAIYVAGVGRPSIPPERLPRALLPQAFYGIRSERQIMERLEHDLLFRWFVGLGIDDGSWDQTTFGKNRDRLLAGDIAHKFLEAILAHPRVKRLLSTDHFSVDGTMIQAWASMKSVRPKDGSGEPPAPGRNGEADFHGQKRTNDTHQSTTDPDARLYRNGDGQPARLCFLGHALMENRNGLVADACLTRADGHAERIAALHMIEPRADRPGVTLGADKGYDTEDFVKELRSMNVAPHVAAKVKAPPSTGAPPAMPATKPARSSASASRRCSAGPRVRPACARRITGGWIASAGGSPSSPPPPTTRSDYRGCWRWARDRSHARNTSNRPLRSLHHRKAAQTTHPQIRDQRTALAKPTAISSAC